MLSLNFYFKTKKLPNDKMNMIAIEEKSTVEIEQLFDDKSHKFMLLQWHKFKNAAS